MLRDKFKLKDIRSVLGVFKGTPNTKDIEIVDLDNMDSPVKMQDWLLDYSNLPKVQRIHAKKKICLFPQEMFLD